MGLTRKSISRNSRSVFLQQCKIEHSVGYFLFDQLFLLTCMEMEEIMDRLERVRAFEAYRNRLIWGLQPQLVDYVKYDVSHAHFALKSINFNPLFSTPESTSTRRTHPQNPLDSTALLKKRQRRPTAEPCSSNPKIFHAIFPHERWKTYERNASSSPLSPRSEMAHKIHQIYPPH